jgi:hypothetical protein
MAWHFMNADVACWKAGPALDTDESRNPPPLMETLRAWPAGSAPVRPCPVPRKAAGIRG